MERVRTQCARLFSLFVRSDPLRLLAVYDRRVHGRAFFSQLGLYRRMMLFFIFQPTSDYSKLVQELLFSGRSELFGASRGVLQIKETSMRFGVHVRESICT